MLILLSQNEQGISASDPQKHIFPSDSSPMKSTFAWIQRHYVNYYKGEQLVWNKPTWKSLNTPTYHCVEPVNKNTIKEKHTPLSLFQDLQAVKGWLILQVFAIPTKSTFPPIKCPAQIVPRLSSVVTRSTIIYNSDKS